MNQRMLPIAALIASLLVFIAALIFGVRTLSPSSTPTAAARAAATPSAVAISFPTATATATATEELATPAAEEATPTAVPVAASPTRATPSSAVAAVIPSPTATTVIAPPSNAPPSGTSPSSPPVVPPTATRTPTVPPAPQPSAAPPTRTPTPPPAPPTATRTPAPPPVVGQPPAGIGVPVRVRIPSLDIDAAIEQVSTDADGNMATPSDPWDTAWYAPGPRPGQRGNAAIAGHVDYHGIGAVVFWDLNKLGPGDEVFVDTEDGKTLRFVVSDSTYYTPADAPLEQIFGPANTPNLNLITCGGTFNPTTREYDHRLVVFTTYAGE